MEVFEAWSEPATGEDAGAVVAVSLTRFEPLGANPDEATKRAARNRAAMMTETLADAGFSRAELLHAMRRLPLDARASHNFGRGFNPADVARIVGECRADRLLLRGDVTEDERDGLLARNPDLDPKRFFLTSRSRAVGYGRDPLPLYRYHAAPADGALALTGGPVGMIEAPRP